MKQVTRKNVFETNSSSSHSLTMSAVDIIDPLVPVEVLRSGVLSVITGEYGWSWERFYGVPGKLSYLFTQLTANQCSDEQELAEYLAQSSEFEMAKNVIQRRLGLELRIEFNPSAYIDHESVGLGISAGWSPSPLVFENEATLEHFLFSESFVETGNDNDSAPTQIQTDRGPEYYYERMYKEVPKDARTFKVLVDSEFEAYSINGTPVDEETMQTLISQGVITQVERLMSKGTRYSWSYGQGKIVSMFGEFEKRHWFVTRDAKLLDQLAPDLRRAEHNPEWDQVLATVLTVSLPASVVKSHAAFFENLKEA